MFHYETLLPRGYTRCRVADPPASFDQRGKPGSNFVDLGHLGGGISDAFGIDNDATLIQVVGQSARADGFVHAFFWTLPGPMIGTVGGGNSHAWDISDHGQIAGSSQDASRQNWAAVWTRSGGTWTMENLGTATGACGAHARGINNGTAGNQAGGAIVGGSTVSTGGSHAAVWTRSLGGWDIQTLGTLPGYVFSSARDINDGGASESGGNGRCDPLPGRATIRPRPTAAWRTFWTHGRCQSEAMRSAFALKRYGETTFRMITGERKVERATGIETS